MLSDPRPSQSKIVEPPRNVAPAPATTITTSPSSEQSIKTGIRHLLEVTDYKLSKDQQSFREQILSAIQRTSGAATFAGIFSVAIGAVILGNGAMASGAALGIGAGFLLVGTIEALVAWRVAHLAYNARAQQAQATSNAK